ncbi:hypothetical protein QUA40_18055 [Microcoleus sp. Pol11C3]|uniref:hypothetical protein n=1 Tax=Microcoleus sp. Pol11C3 TaxID=3055390 RepID=UPI002FD22691
MSLTPYKSTKSLITWSENGRIPYGYTIAKNLDFLGNMVWLLFLLALLGVTSVVWLWVASFRSGWKFLSWLNAQPTDQTVMATNVFYHFIIMLVSPFALFASWSQKQIQQWLGISFPSEIDLHSIIEEQLGFKLGDGSPYLPAPTKKSSDP